MTLENKHVYKTLACFATVYGSHGFRGHLLFEDLYPKEVTLNRTLVLLYLRLLE